MGFPPRVISGSLSRCEDDVEGGQGGAGGGGTETQARYAGRVPMLHILLEKHGENTESGGSGRAQEAAPEDVLPSNGAGLAGMGYACNSRTTTATRRNYRTRSFRCRRDLDMDGCINMGGGNKKGQVTAKCSFRRPDEQRTEKSPIPRQSGRLTKDEDQHSCHDEFFPPNALIPRLPIASLFVSPNCSGSGNDPLRDVGVSRPPWSAGEQCNQQYGGDDKRREIGFTSRKQCRGSFVGSVPVPAMKQDLIQTHRPHTVASGFRELGLTYCSRSRGVGSHGNDIDTPIDTWNIGDVMGTARRGRKRYVVGSIIGDIEKGMGVESSTVTLLNCGGGGSASGHGGTDTSAMRTASNPVKQANERTPGDGGGEQQRFARIQQEINNMDARDIDLFGSAGPKGTPDSRPKSATSRKWGATRRRVVGGTVTGLTAEALGRSSVHLDRSGRVKLVEKVNTGSILNTGVRLVFHFVHTRRIPKQTS